MSREGTGALSIKEKWALDSQLGEMLRGLEKSRPDPEKEFAERLNKLMAEHHMNIHEALDILELVEDCTSLK